LTVCLKTADNRKSHQITTDQ